MTDFEFPRVHLRGHADSGIGLAPHLSCAQIAATATALPDTVITNQDIIDAYGHQVAARPIGKMVGVFERRVAALGVVDTDLLALAAQRCLEQAQVRPEQLSKLIVTKFLGDRMLPMTAALLQRKLDCGLAVQSFDVDGGIHSFLQALHVANCAIACGDGPILIVSGGVINCLVSRTDPRLAFQFGDGAAAVLLTPADRPHILANYGFSNYDYVGLQSCPSVPHLMSDTMYDTAQYGSLFDLYQEQGFKGCKDFVQRAMEITAQALLTEANRTMADVTLFLITENHPQISAAIVERLAIAPGRTLSLRETRGNTMSAMLPMLLDEAIRTGMAQAGALVMLLSLGEGLSGGGMLIQF